VAADFGAQPPTLLTKPLDYPHLLETLKDQPQSCENGANAASPVI
jgi:hypothetical protein